MSKRQPNFKTYQPKQLMLLPPSLNELIPDNHVVRIVDEVINKVSMEVLSSAYNLKDL